VGEDGDESSYTSLGSHYILHEFKRGFRFFSTEIEGVSSRRDVGFRESRKFKARAKPCQLDEGF